MKVPALLTSKRFWVLVISLVSSVLLGNVEGLDTHRWETIIGLVTVLGVTVIGGYTFQDSVTAFGEIQANKGVDQNTALHDTLDYVLDELLRTPSSVPPDAAVQTVSEAKSKILLALKTPKSKTLLLKTPPPK